MNHHTSLKIAAIIALLFGLAMAFSPGTLAAIYGAEPPNITGLYNSSLFGAALLGLAVINWLASTSRHAIEVRSVLVGNLVGAVIGFIIALYHQQLSDVSPSSWFNVTLYLALTFAFATSLRQERGEAIME